MKRKQALGLLALGAVAVVAVSLLADEPTVIPLSKEPHHHIQLHNDYVNVYKVSVEPGDTVLLHKHFYDAISVMVQGASVTVHSPGKPDAKQELTAAQVRLQPNGYTHSTEIGKDSLPYRNITLELLIPQGTYHNLCTSVVPGEPLNCPTGTDSLASVDVPQFRSDLTNITLMRIKPGQSVKVGSASDEQLFVMLDDATAGMKQMKSEDFMWLEKGSAATVVKNPGTSEAKLVLFDFKPKM